MGIGWEHDLITHADGQPRCGWCGTDPLYVAYHDADWGVPETDSRALFEKLVLDGFQAGLSWLTILRKREGFRRAFDGFDAERIASYGPERLAALMQDVSIVRNRAKITGTVASARAYLEIEARTGFARWLWDRVEGVPLQPRFATRGEVPAATGLAESLSRDLRQAGFTFCGPTIVYAFMQAVGMTNDHLVACHRHQPCAELGATLTW